ncbi:MAG: phosphatidate cytidylyltransferase [Candidatus Sulfotelmatobacter sp.]
MLKRIATAVVLIPLVLALILHAPVWALAVVAGIVALVTIHEFLKLTVSYGVQPMGWPTHLFAGLFFFTLAVTGAGTPLLLTGKFLVTLAFAAAIVPFIFLTRAMRNEDLRAGYPAAAASVFAFTYIALPMGMLVQLRQQWAGAFYLLYLLLVVWSGDIFAYFVGKSIGRHLLAPRISPKKTWEGAIASLLASVAVGWLLFHHAERISSTLLHANLIERRDGLFGPIQPAIGTIILLTIVLNIAAQLGDLVESLIKRGAGVKDSGAILPGHGGMLDRIDALLFAAPVLWFYAAWRVMQ